MMNTTRREFLQKSALLVATLYAGDLFAIGKSKPLLSFSTLGCPDWSFKQITDFAVEHGYKAIEVRGIQRQLDLTKCKEFSSPQNIDATLKLMKEKGLRFINLGASANLHFAEGAEREKNLEEARKFIDLAAKINCPYIRVFPNNFPKDQDKNTTMTLIAKGLSHLGDYAKDKKVMVLMETHGEVVMMNDIEKIMQLASNSNVGLVWDVANMWAVTREAPAEVYQKLKKYIHHTHIKDLKLVDGKDQYTLLGQGEIPIFQAIDVLYKGGYKGYYSFEWEKLWHPEIAEPEIALADYSKVMKQYFKS
jgi:sugar phosphate isomerase/epimerase